LSLWDISGKVVVCATWDTLRSLRISFCLLHCQHGLGFVLAREIVSSFTAASGE
jgi:hypothetical protein